MYSWNNFETHHFGQLAVQALKTSGPPIIKFSDNFSFCLSKRQIRLDKSSFASIVTHQNRGTMSVNQSLYLPNLLNYY
jgi:hypothetical protein